MQAACLLFFLLTCRALYAAQDTEPTNCLAHYSLFGIRDYLIFILPLGPAKPGTLSGSPATLPGADTIHLPR